MALSGKNIFRLLLITASIAALALVVQYRAPSSETYASAAISMAGSGLEDDASDGTAVASCSNTACNSACWADGSHSNAGTTASRTNKSPKTCAPGTGGCVTKACPCANTGCVSACWVDGVTFKSGTVAIKTVFQPIDCPAGSGGCREAPCS